MKTAYEIKLETINAPSHYCNNCLTQKADLMISYKNEEVFCCRDCEVELITTANKIGLKIELTQLKNYRKQDCHCHE